MPVLTPVIQILYSAMVTSIGAGGAHTLFIQNDRGTAGTIRGVGANGYNQIGMGDNPIDPVLYPSMPIIKF